MEKRIDVVLSFSETSAEFIMDDKQSTEINHIMLDMQLSDELLPCSQSMSTAENGGGVILWEMINNGVTKVSSDQDSARSKSWTIYKVEQNLKNVHDEDTFRPKLVSIGPFHHNKSDHLKPMEQHKWRFLSKFLKNCVMYPRFDNQETHAIIMTKKIQCLVAAMEKLEAGARACYSETFDDMDSKEFVLMMVLDGCFIIQLLLLFLESGHRRFTESGRRSMKSGSRCRDADDPIYTWRSTLPYLRHDLLLLENQLPFIVLQEIFTMSGMFKNISMLTDLILHFFNPVLFRENKVLNVCKKDMDIISKSKDSCHHNHLLDLFMSSFHARKTVRQEDQDTFDDGRRYKLNPEYIPNDGRDVSIHCVTELREGGIEFKKRDHHDLLDIEFKGGKLHIPTLFIDDNTVPVLLNFIAYEQRHHSVKPYFTSYLMFLDYLVNSSKDVEHLHYKGIINHGLGSDEDVATLFNTLCKEVVRELGDDNYLSKVFKDVNKYFGKRTNRWRAAWKHEYFRNPWAFSSFLAAIVLIVLTFLQTFYTMYAYFYPPS